MASPFDFSSFLLTPPIPGHSTGHTPPVSGQDGQHGQGESQSQQHLQQHQQQQHNNNNNNLNVSNGHLHPHRHLQQQQQQHYASTSGAHQNEQPSSAAASGSGSGGGAQRYSSIDERDYGLDPSAFSSVSFQMPSFLAAATTPGQFGEGSGGPSMVDPSAFHAAPPTNPYQSQYASMQPSSLDSGYSSGMMGQQQQQQQQLHMHSPQQQQQPLGQQQQQQQQGQQGGASGNARKAKYVPDIKNPVYGIYGSSVISVNPDLSPFKLGTMQPAQHNFGGQSTLLSPGIMNEDSRSNSPDFDPKSLGLPVGNNLFPQPLPGLYSSSGFDMLGVLARVVARPHPQINIGPVDTSCSFLVVDARRYDMPIVFASSTFTELTGYANSEVIGRNCRFLQAPDGAVAMGSKRKYTDGNAVYHLKTHIQSGKETQASIINYRKDGSPFINLVTVIPITWDTDEIAYFVGFQVDLVEQPNAILERMRNGTYVVNYSLLPTQTVPPQNLLDLHAQAQAEVDNQQQQMDAKKAANEEPGTAATAEASSIWQDQKPVKIVNTVASGAAQNAAAQSSMTIAPELLEVMGLVGSEAEELDDDAAKKKWNKILLDHTGDFVHVLSLKGSFLYVSPSVKGMLEYEPSDLIGKTLQSVCHPSDIVPVMRELKEASTVSHPIINLLYRFRRKRSGYIWMEAQGKLYLEQSKSRKCVILVGRERPVYKLSWNELNAAGGLGDKEFWSKVSPDGMFLYNTPTVKAVIGHEADQLKGSSMYDLLEPEKRAELQKALQEAGAGGSVRLHHKLKNAKGTLVDVITNFYPNTQPQNMPAAARKGGAVHQPSIILQTNEYASEMRRRATMATTPGALPVPQGLVSPGMTEATLKTSRPAFMRTSSSAVRDMIVSTPSASESSDSPPGDGSGSGSGSDSSAPSTFSAIPSTYKTLLQHPSAQSDNVFDELDTTRTTSWQYELHQLKLTNKKLKEELAMLQAAKRKRKKKEEMTAQGIGSNQGSPPPSANPAQKTCANCGRTDSPEWRVGPSGARNLCNACGLRWAKATRGAGHRTQSGTPSSSTPSSGSDMEHANSYLHPGGPFVRPKFESA